MVGQVIYMSLTCEHSNVMNLAVNLTSNCNKNCFCDGVAYSPVCYAKTSTTFYSPCHAACNRWDNEKKLFSGCSCAAELLDAFGNDARVSLPATTFVAATPSNFLMIFLLLLLTASYSMLKVPSMIKHRNIWMTKLQDNWITTLWKTTILLKTQ